MKTWRLKHILPVLLALLGLQLRAQKVKDADGNNYNEVKIPHKTWLWANTQTWLGSSLSVTHYRNGDEIPEIKDAMQFAALKTGGWCYAPDGKTRLYNWYAVTDPRGLAPEGYHIPLRADWEALVRAMYQKADAFDYNRDIPKENAKKLSDWNVQPGDWTKAIGAYFWSADQSDSLRALAYNMSPPDSVPGEIFKTTMLQVRCIKSDTASALPVLSYTWQGDSFQVGFPLKPALNDSRDKLLKGHHPSELLSLPLAVTGYFVRYKTYSDEEIANPDPLLQISQTVFEALRFEQDIYNTGDLLNVQPYMHQSQYPGFTYGFQLNTLNGPKRYARCADIQVGHRFYTLLLERNNSLPSEQEWKAFLASFMPLNQ